MSHRAGSRTDTRQLGGQRVAAQRPQPVPHPHACLSSSTRRHTRSVSAFLLNRSSDLTTLPTAYDVYPLDGRHDGGYYTVKDCVTIDVLPRTPGNNVYVGFMV